MPSDRSFHTSFYGEKSNRRRIYQTDLTCKHCLRAFRYVIFEKICLLGCFAHKTLLLSVNYDRPQSFKFVQISFFQNNTNLGSFQARSSMKMNARYVYPSGRMSLTLGTVGCIFWVYSQYTIFGPPPSYQFCTWV